ncbi:MAG: MFS transporter [Deltaproteobacteria bacterium]|nr:MFS transporter [Deltaproteobacteria bacterium]
MLNIVRKVFASLRYRDFRLFWIGQAVSLIGTWMQSIGQAWLILKLTNSPFLLGLIGAAQYTPILVLSIFAGSIVDRFPKRHLIILTQTVMAILALLLWVLTAEGVVDYWHILVLASLLGLATSLDVPARQAFMIDLVGRDSLMNAIALNSTTFNLARLIGPAIAGLLIARVGIATTFLLNGVSFLPVIAGLLMIDRDGLPGKSTRKNVIEDVKEGLVSIKNNALVFHVMMLMLLVSLFAINFNVVVPVYAKYIFHNSPEVFGFLMSSLGVGSLIGAILVALRSSRSPSPVFLIIGGTILSAFQMVMAFVTGMYSAMMVLFLIGFGAIIFTALTNTTIQLNTPDELRGRAMSVYSIVFMGVTPIGNLFIGGIADVLGIRPSIFIGGILGLVPSLYYLRKFLDPKNAPDA